MTQVQKRNIRLVTRSEGIWAPAAQMGQNHCRIIPVKVSTTISHTGATCLSLCTEGVAICEDATVTTGPFLFATSSAMGTTDSFSPQYTVVLKFTNLTWGPASESKAAKNICTADPSLLEMSSPSSKLAFGCRSERMAAYLALRSVTNCKRKYFVRIAHVLQVEEAFD